MHGRHTATAVPKLAMGVRFPSPAPSVMSRDRCQLSRGIGHPHPLHAKPQVRRLFGGLDANGSRRLCVSEATQCVRTRFMLDIVAPVAG